MTAIYGPVLGGIRRIRSQRPYQSRMRHFLAEIGEHWRVSPQLSRLSIGVQHRHYSRSRRSGSVNIAGLIDQEKWVLVFSARYERESRREQKSAKKGLV